MDGLALYHKNQIYPFHFLQEWFVKLITATHLNGSCCRGAEVPRQHEAMLAARSRYVCETQDHSLTASLGGITHESAFDSASISVD
jgi:hypothetical protein